MKRFHFPLDRVLRYRQLLAEAEEAKLQGQLAGVHQMDEAIARLERERTRTEEAIRESLAANRQVKSAELASYPDYRSLLARNERGLADERRRRLAEAEQQRTRVLAAHRSREILEQARAQAHDRWRTDHGKEQDATAGELYLGQWKRHARK